MKLFNILALAFFAIALVVTASKAVDLTNAPVNTKRIVVWADESTPIYVSVDLNQIEDKLNNVKSTLYRVSDEYETREVKASFNCSAQPNIKDQADQAFRFTSKAWEVSLYNKVCNR